MTVWRQKIRSTRGEFQPREVSGDACFARHRGVGLHPLRERGVCRLGVLLGLPLADRHHFVVFEDDPVGDVARCVGHDGDDPGAGLGLQLDLVVLVCVGNHSCVQADSSVLIDRLASRVGARNVALIGIAG